MSQLSIIDKNLVVADSTSQDSVNLIFTRLKGTEIWHQTLSKVGNGRVDTSRLGSGTYEVRLDNIIEFTQTRAHGRGTNPNWGKWIYASVVTHFAESTSLLQFLDGMRFDDAIIPCYFLKMDGPWYRSLGGGVWEVQVHVSVDAKCIKSDIQAMYTFRKTLGELASAFTTIPLVKYGTGEDDDSTEFGCLTLGTKEAINTNYAGQRGVNLEGLSMASIDKYYTVKLRS